MIRRLTLVLALLFSLVAVLPATAGHERRRSLDPVATLEQQGRRQGERLHSTLHEIEELALQLPPCSTRDAILERVDRAVQLGDRIGETQAQLVTLAGAPVMVQPRDPVPVSQEDFAVIVAALDRQHWDDDKLRLLADAARGRWFTTAQVRTVMRMFQWGDGKIDAAVMLSKQTVDPENLWQTGEELTWSSERQTLRQRLTG